MSTIEYKSTVMKQEISLIKTEIRMYERWKQRATSDFDYDKKLSQLRLKLSELEDKYKIVTNHRPRC